MDSDHTLSAYKIRQIIHRTPAEVQSGTSLGEVVGAMRRKRASVALVWEQDRLVGRFSERDLVVLIQAGNANLNLPISALMTRDPVSLTLDATVKEAVDLMVRENCRNLALIDADGNAQGVLTAEDILQHIAEHFPAEVLNLPPKVHQIAKRSEGG